MDRRDAVRYGHARMTGLATLIDVFKGVMRRYKRRVRVPLRTETALWTAVRKRYARRKFTRYDVDLYVGSRL